MGILRIGALGVAGALLAVQFKSGKSEYGIYLSIAMSLVIFFSILGNLQIVVEEVQQIAGFLNLDSAYSGTLLKMVGITYVAEFSSSICKDAGYQTISQQIEIFGKLAILVLSMPVLLALLDTIREFLA